MREPITVRCRYVDGSPVYDLLAQAHIPADELKRLALIGAKWAKFDADPALLISMLTKVKTVEVEHPSPSAGVPRGEPGTKAAQHSPSSKGEAFLSEFSLTDFNLQGPPADVVLAM